VVAGEAVVGAYGIGHGGRAFAHAYDHLAGLLQLLQRAAGGGLGLDAGGGHGGYKGGTCQRYVRGHQAHGEVSSGSGRIENAMQLLFGRPWCRALPAAHESARPVAGAACLSRSCINYPANGGGFITMKRKKVMLAAYDPAARVRRGSRRGKAIAGGQTGLFG
jgi:hypothetical protein